MCVCGVGGFAADLGSDVLEVEFCKDEFWIGCLEIDSGWDKIQEIGLLL